MGADTIVRNAWKKLTKKGENVRITKKMLAKSNERKKRSDFYSVGSCVCAFNDCIG